MVGLLEIVAAFGLGIAVYAAMETEIEEVGRRALFGLIGLTIFAICIFLL